MTDEDLRDTGATVARVWRAWQAAETERPFDPDDGVATDAAWDRYRARLRDAGVLDRASG